MKYLMVVLLLGSVAVLMPGCALVTTYGGKPKQDAIEKDRYAFTIYYNIFATSFDAESLAKKEFVRFMEKEGYEHFEIVKVHANPQTQRNVYEVKFSKHSPSTVDPAEDSSENAATGDGMARPVIPSIYEDFLRCVVVIRNSAGLGTGFFVTSDGYLITNLHVVGDNDQVSLRLKDGSTMLGKVVETDAERDLALVFVHRSNVPHLILALPEEMGVGSDVLAIGTPLGLAWSVSKGIISAHREDGSISMLQTDAAINPGNSGGPLISLKSGKVAGVNTWKYRESEGLNFAVRADEILKAFPRLMK